MWSTINASTFDFLADEYRQNYGKKKVIKSGLSMNILRAGDKSPVQRGFFTNSAGDLLPALGFLGGLHNFCNYIFFNVSHDM